MSRFENRDNFCRSLIALEHYDGPMAGVGFLPDDSGVYFRIIAWDEEQWQRIYAVSLVPKNAVSDVRNAFAVVQPPREPIWCPSGNGNDLTQLAIDRSVAAVTTFAHDAKSWLVVESHDLIGKSSIAKLNTSEMGKLKTLLNSRRVLDVQSQAPLGEFFDWLSTTL